MTWIIMLYSTNHVQNQLWLKVILEPREERSTFVHIQWIQSTPWLHTHIFSLNYSRCSWSVLLLMGKTGSSGIWGGGGVQTSQSDKNDVTLSQWKPHLFGPHIMSLMYNEKECSAAFIILTNIDSISREVQ